jgi:isopentenyl diphosphate isomerase/L-lactate dehydrogenase-like FMN-dependent dehydrogenase
LTVEDFRQLAKRRLPRVAFDYVDGGAESELTYKENRNAFDQVWLRPQQGITIDKPDLATKVLGVDISMPLIIGPCGGARMVNPAGDLAAARAAEKAGTIFTLATRSGHSLEEIAEASSGPLWYQVYNVRGRSTVENAIDRAKTAGYRAIVLTFDTQKDGKRERDLRNGRTALFGANKLKALPYVPQLLRKPVWFAHRFADGLIPPAPNVTEANEVAGSYFLSSEVRAGSLGWSDIEWVRARWDGPILVKGILTGRDAKKALDHGMNGIVVSNHGGRQLDGAPSSIAMLPPIAEAVGADIEVMFDGGIRSGQDILRAVALGARSCLCGRAYIYGLGAGGQAGVAAAIDIMRKELDISMALTGVTSVAEIDRRVIASI